MNRDGFISNHKPRKQHRIYMNGIDSSLLSQIFFGIAVIVFLISLYIILPAFLFNKRTMLRPELINAMWYRMYGVSIGKLKNHWNRIKKKDDSNRLKIIGVLATLKTSKKKIRLGLYEH